MEADLVQFNRLLSGEIDNYTLEKRFVRKNGELIWTNLSVGCVRNNDKSVNYTVALLHDITQRKHTELRLQESERRFSDMMGQVHLCSAMLDKQANITFANDYFLKLTGWDREEIIGQNWFNLFIPTEATVRIDLFKGLNDGTVPLYNENEILTRTGERRLIAWSNTVLHDEFGNAEGIAGIGVDITERKKWEEALTKSEALLRELNASKDKFFSIIAHDLKGPFNNILGFSELLVENQKTLSNEEKEGFLRIIFTTTKNTYQLLEELLTWARTQSGNIRLEPQHFNLRGLIEDVIGVLSHTAKKKEIGINNTVDPDIAVFLDRNTLNTIIRNLVANAIKYTGEKGTVTVSANLGNNEIVMSISDTGIGMDKETTQSLFKIAETISRPGTANEKGTGLGLILCKEFIEKQNGSIWVESEVGKGSTFSFKLPISKGSS